MLPRRRASRISGAGSGLDADRPLAAAAPLGVHRGGGIAGLIPPPHRHHRGVRAGVPGPGVPAAAAGAAGAGRSAAAWSAWALSRACAVRCCLLIWVGHASTGIRPPIRSSSSGSSSASDRGCRPAARAARSRSSARMSLKEGTSPSGGSPVQRRVCQSWVTGSQKKT